MRPLGADLSPKKSIDQLTRRLPILSGSRAHKMLYEMQDFLNEILDNDHLTIDEKIATFDAVTKIISEQSDDYGDRTAFSDLLETILSGDTTDKRKLEDEINEEAAGVMHPISPQIAAKNKNLSVSLPFMKTVGDSDKKQTQPKEINIETEIGKHTLEDNDINVSSKSSSQKESNEHEYYSKYDYTHDVSDVDEDYVDNEEDKSNENEEDESEDKFTDYGPDNNEEDDKDYEGDGSEDYSEGYGDDDDDKDDDNDDDDDSDDEEDNEEDNDDDEDDDEDNDSDDDDNDKDQDDDEEYDEDEGVSESGQENASKTTLDDDKKKLLQKWNTFRE